MLMPTSPLITDLKAMDDGERFLKTEGCQGPAVSQFHENLIRASNTRLSMQQEARGGTIVPTSLAACLAVHDVMVSSKNHIRNAKAYLRVPETSVSEPHDAGREQVLQRELRGTLHEEYRAATRIRDGPELAPIAPGDTALRAVRLWPPMPSVTTKRCRARCRKLKMRTDGHSGAMPRTRFGDLVLTWRCSNGSDSQARNASLDRPARRLVGAGTDSVQDLAGLYRFGSASGSRAVKSDYAAARMRATCRRGFRWRFSMWRSPIS